MALDPLFFFAMLTVSYMTRPIGRLTRLLRMRAYSDSGLQAMSIRGCNLPPYRPPKFALISVIRVKPLLNLGVSALITVSAFSLFARAARTFPLFPAPFAKSPTLAMLRRLK